MLNRPDKNTIEYPILDGFLFQRDRRCDLTFGSLAIEQYEALRRSGAFRQKQWCIPGDVLSTEIPARDSYEYQLDVGIGAAIYAYTFVGNTDQQIMPGFATQAFQVRDACDDQALFQEPITRQFVNPLLDVAPQQLLSRLFTVGPPGLLNITIASMYDSDQRAQLILYGGTPARAR